MTVVNRAMIKLATVLIRKEVFTADVILALVHGIKGGYLNKH